MANAAFDRIKLAVEERWHCKLPDGDGDEFELVLDDRQGVKVSFDEETGQLTVSALLGVSPGSLSLRAKRHLLARNLPTAGMAGSLVRVAGGSALELVNVLPVAALPAAEIAGMAANQGAEAIRLARWLEDDASRN